MGRCGPGCEVYEKQVLHHRPSSRDFPSKSRPRTSWSSMTEYSFSHRRLYAGTLIFFTMSSTTPRAVRPEKRACGCMTRRCAMTGTASS